MYILDLYTHLKIQTLDDLKCVIDTDAHTPEQLKFIPLGEAITRRGWASKTDVLNTKTAKELKTCLVKK